MKVLDTAALFLIIVGGINWGLVGAFDFNLVESILGDESTLSRIVYVVVGIAAVYSLIPLVAHMADNKEAQS